MAGACWLFTLFLRHCSGAGFRELRDFDVQGAPCLGGEPGKQTTQCACCVCETDMQEAEQGLRSQSAQGIGEMWEEESGF